MLAFVAVRSDEVASDNHVASELAATPEVLEVHHVAGDDCYLVKVRARDAEHLGHLLRTRIGRIAGVRSTRTTIVLETVKETSRLPIPRARGGDAMTPSSPRERRARLLRLDCGLPDLGHDVSRHPHHARDDAAGADVLRCDGSIAGGLLVVYVATARRAAAARVTMGRHRPDGIPDARGSATAASCSPSSGCRAGSQR